MALLAWVKKKPGELFPGTVKPTTTVAHMLVAEMFQNLDINLNTYGTSKFPSFQIELDYHWKGGQNILHVRGVRVNNHPSIVFDEHELSIFLDAANNFDKLQTAKREADKATRVQQSAIDFIASLTKTEEVKDEEGKSHQGGTVSREAGEVRAPEGKKLLQRDKHVDTSGNRGCNPSAAHDRAASEYGLTALEA